MLASTDLLEAVRLVKLDGCKGRIDVDAGRPSGDRCGFGSPEQSRPYPVVSGFASDVHSRAVLVPVDPMRRKTQHFRRLAQRANRNVEDFATVHGVHVQVALYLGAPVAYDSRVVVQRTDRTNGIQVRRGNLVRVRKPRTTNREVDPLFHRLSYGVIEDVRSFDGPRALVEWTAA